MRKRNLSIILVLALMLSMIIAPTVFTSAKVDSGLTSIGNYSRSDMYDDTPGGGPGREGGDLYSTTITIY